MYEQTLDIFLGFMDCLFISKRASDATLIGTSVAVCIYSKMIYVYYSGRSYFILVRLNKLHGHNMNVECINVLQNLFK